MRDGGDGHRGFRKKPFDLFQAQCDDHFEYRGICRFAETHVGKPPGNAEVFDHVCRIDSGEGVFVDERKRLLDKSCGW